MTDHARNIESAATELQSAAEEWRLPWRPKYEQLMAAARYVREVEAKLTAATAVVEAAQNYSNAWERNECRAAGPSLTELQTEYRLRELARGFGREGRKG